MLPALYPDLAAGKVQRAFQAGHVLISFHRNLPPISQRSRQNTNMIVHLHVLVAVDLRSKTPLLTVTFEDSSVRQGSLFTFDASGQRLSLGENEALRDEENFVSVGNNLIKDLLKLGEIAELRQPSTGKTRSRFSKNTRGVLIVGALLFAILGFGLATKDGPIFRNSPADNSIRSAGPSTGDVFGLEDETSPSLTPVPIRHGVYEVDSIDERVAPLKIVTKAGSNYFVKVVAHPSKLTILKAYIIGGRPFDTKVPIGQYEIRYAAGNIWYGETVHFGETTLYSKADRVFDFARQGVTINGYTIELILQVQGNLRTNSISKSQF